MKLQSRGLLSLAFVVGLLGGAVYVHGFILIAKVTKPSQRETALSSASLADTFGIMTSYVADSPAPHCCLLSCVFVCFLLFVCLWVGCCFLVFCCSCSCFFSTSIIKLHPPCLSRHCDSPIKACANHSVTYIHPCYFSNQPPHPATCLAFWYKAVFMASTESRTTGNRRPFNAATIFPL